MKWQDFEAHARTIASYIWDVPACTETINGVKCDCVLKHKSDYWVLVEITKEDVLGKLRTDLAKFASIRPYLHSQGIYAECFFVSENQLTDQLKETGRGQHVSVLSLNEFNKLFLDFQKYSFARAARKFGSAVDPISGEKDTKQYVPVKYIGKNPEKELTVDDLVNALVNKKRIVLLGNYGTGKSRCIQELYLKLSANKQSELIYPIAIDLRDNWGTKRGYEIVQRHFEDLGLGEDVSKLIKILDKNSLCFLLDGFDEIGSQAWSDDSSRLSRIRSESLLGVKDLITRSKGGLIITGREHYFNSDNEMFQCLGLSKDSTMIVRCAEEFSEAEMHRYLGLKAQNITLPTWLPRRPLVCQLLLDMGDHTIAKIEHKQAAETVFWDSFILALCERESKIHSALDADTIRRVLRQLARVTRTKTQNVGPLTIMELNKAFTDITGYNPVDESAVMLQRLPALGRLASESTDRYFVDEYILDGLRAEDIQEIATIHSNFGATKDICNESWKNPLQNFGLALLSKSICEGTLGNYLRLMRLAADRRNAVLAGDILASVLMSTDEPVDLGELNLSDSHIKYLDLSSHAVSNLKINQSILEEVDITECQVKNVYIKNCEINQLTGVTDAKGLPDWICDSGIEKFESITTVSRIRTAHLSTEQRIFVTLVKKMFFQPGSGRKEEALLRGLGAAADRKIAESILNQLIGMSIITKFRGKEGWVYSPERKYAHRMKTILNELTLSKDVLWQSLRN